MRPEALPCAGKAGATAFSVDGTGEEAVVLIHGVGMARRVWAPQIEALARRHTVLSYDMLGHGDSDLPAADVTLARYADQLRELLDALGLARAHVVGHSMGALVALEFALNHPERTRRVVAMNAVFQRSPEQRAAVMARAQALHDTDLSDSVGPTIERWFGRPVPAALARPAAEVEALLRGVQPLGYARTYALFASSDSVHAERLPRLEAPALFLTAEFDANSSPAMSEAMARQVRQGTWQVIAGARHMMGVTHPAEVNARLEAFLCDGRQ